MSPRRPTPSTRARSRRAWRAWIVRAALAGLLGLAAALLVSCASSSDKLIPVADAGPLHSDLQAISQDAAVGNGSCSVTERAILKTEQDFDALPATLDAGLRETLRQGIENLRARSLVECAQPLVQSTPTSTTTASTPTTTTTTTTTATTPPSTTPETPPTSTTPAGGTTAPGTGESSAGPPNGQGGGTGVGESGAPNGAGGQENGLGAPGNGAGGQENAK